MTDEKLIERARGFAEWWDDNPQNGDVIYGVIRMVDSPNGRVPEERTVSASFLRELADALEAHAQSEPTDADERKAARREAFSELREFDEAQAEPVTVTDDMVERAAAEVWTQLLGMDWSEAYGRSKRDYRRAARAALAAALSPKEETDE